MRCAISLASASISCMVLLPVRLENTDCGCRTPTTAQTSRTTDNRVISRSLVWSTLVRHAYQRLAVQRAVRRLPGIGRDVLAELVQLHALELAVGVRLAGLLGGVVFFQD